MIEIPMAHTAPRGSDGEATTIKKVPRPVAILGSFINNLRGKEKRDLMIGPFIPIDFLKPFYLIFKYMPITK